MFTAGFQAGINLACVRSSHHQLHVNMFIDCQSMEFTKLKRTTGKTNTTEDPLEICSPESWDASAQILDLGVQI